MSNRYLAAVQSTSLKSPAAPNSASFVVYKFLDRKGNQFSDMSVFGEFFVGVIKQGTKWEQVKFSNFSYNADGSAVLTVATNGRNCLPIYPYSGSTMGEDFNVSAEFIVTNDMVSMDFFGNKFNANVWQGLNTFLSSPRSLVDPLNPNDLTRLSYVQSLVLGTLTTINVIVPGKSGATIAQGQLVYFDDASNVWLLCDADIPSTVNNVLLGIAQGAGTVGNAIANGILLQGLDTYQSGLVEGQTYYASNTPGAISTTPGTTSVAVGIGGEAANELYFNPRFNQQITKDQFDALAGNGGSPSAMNRYVTELGLALSGLATLGGNGSDGALNVATGTTTLNLSQVYNFTTITVAIGATLAFTGTGPALMNATGAIDIQGNVELRGLVISAFSGQTTRNAFRSGAALATITAPNGEGGAGGVAPSSSNNGGAGGTSTAAGIGTGGAHGTPGAAGQGGLTSSTGGGGGGGGDGGGSGTDGAQSTTDDGGAGGNGYSSSGSTSGGGGGGGGGRNAGNGGAGGIGGSGVPSSKGGTGGNSGATGGNGGNGGLGGSYVGAGSGDGRDGGDGGHGYVNGGNGGQGGNALNFNNTKTGGNGGRGGDGITGNGGNGGQGGQSSDSVGGNGGRGGNSKYATGGNGGVGGNNIGNGGSAMGGNGGRGGDGRTGGNGGNGATSGLVGFGSTYDTGGTGGRGGDGKAGSSPLIIYGASTVNFTGTINGQGGNGGTGGNGGNGGGNGGQGGNGGNGGDGGDGADVIILVGGAVTNSGTVNNTGGTGGNGGTAGANGSANVVTFGAHGEPGRYGRNGLAIITRLITAM